MPEGVFPDEALRQATAPTPKDFSKTDRNALEEAFGVPVEQLERKVYISKPAKTASQHGWGVCVLWFVYTHTAELTFLGHALYKKPSMD